jgi:hypothetical protein
MLELATPGRREMSLIAVRGRRWVIQTVVLSSLGVGAVLGGWWWRGTRPVDPLVTGLAAYERRDWPAAEKVAPAAQDPAG